MPKEYVLSPKGRKVLAQHVQALSAKYSRISEADAEIRKLCKQFTELEKAGKPLPEPPKPTEKNKGEER